MVLYSNTRTVQIAEFPEISHLLSQHNSSLSRHVNVTSRRSLEIQGSLSLNQEPIRSENMYEY